MSTRSLPLLQIPYLIHHQTPHWFYLMNVFCECVSHLHFHHHTMSKLTSSIARTNRFTHVYFCIPTSVLFFIMQPSDYFTPWRIPWTVWSMGSQESQILTATFTFKTAEKSPCLEMHMEAFVNEVVWCLRFTLKNIPEKVMVRRKIRQDTACWLPLKLGYLGTEGIHFHYSF